MKTILKHFSTKVLVNQTVKHKELKFPFDFCLSYRDKKIEITSNSSLDQH